MPGSRDSDILSTTAIGPEQAHDSLCASSCSAKMAASGLEASLGKPSDNQAGTRPPSRKKQKNPEPYTLKLANPFRSLQ